MNCLIRLPILVFAVLAVLAAGEIPLPANAEARAPRDETEAGFAHFAIKAALIYREAGSPAERNAWIEIKDGVVVGGGNGEVPSDLEVIDFGDACIIPGLVDAGDGIGGAADAKGLKAGYVGADRLDAFGRYDSVLSRGVTTTRMSAGNRQFVGGIGSVVKLGGPGRNTVLVRDADLSVNFTDEGGRDARESGEAPLPSSSDVPFERTRAVRPLTRLGRVPALKALIEAAEAHRRKEALDWREAGAYDVALAALATYLDGAQKPLRIEARRAADLRQAVLAAHEIQRPVQLFGLDEAHLVIDLMTGIGDVVVEVPADLSQPSIDAVDTVNPWRRSPHTAALLLGRARMALSAADGDLLLAAGRTVTGDGAGLTPAQALAAVTQWPADILGLGHKVGALTNGRDADFAVVRGDPLSIHAEVAETWVEGRRVWEQRVESQATVIRAARVYDGLGGVQDDAEILIEDGRIVSVGSRVARPRGARFIDGGAGSVATPGFIDAHGHIGLYGDRARPTPDMDLADVFVVTRPEFHSLAAAGVTTVAVAPRDADQNGARVVAVKTWGMGAGKVVAKPLAALKLHAQGDGETTERTLDALFKKAKAYDDAWRKYEDELAKWKAGGVVKTPTPEAKAPEPKPDEKGKDDPITGTWEVTITSEMIPEAEKGILKLKLNDDNTITGTTASSMMDDAEMPVSGKLDGKNVTLEIVIDVGPTPMPIPTPTIKAVLDRPDHMTGKLDIADIISLDLDAVRTEKGAPVIRVTRTKKKEEGAGPKKPKLDAAMEPYRDLFAGKIGVVLVASTPHQVRAAVKVMAPFKIKPMVLGIGALPSETYDEFEDSVSVAFPGRELLATKKRSQVLRIHEAAAAGLLVTIQSSAEAAAAGLPAQVKNAVRQGLGADLALRAFTSAAAEALNLGDVVGSLRRGRDGDVLLWSGEPFEAGTLLKKVIVKGEEVQAMKHVLAVMMCVVLTAWAPGQEGGKPAPKTAYAVKAGKVLTMDKSDTIANNAVVLVKDGKVEKIQSLREAIPEGYTVLDYSNRWVVPGFIDCHNHIAGSLFELNDGVWLTNPGLRTLDVVDPNNPDLKRALAGGVTTVLLIPGSGNNMSGFGTITRTAGDSQAEMVLKYPGSLKIAQAGNPERWYWNPQRSYMNYNIRQTLQKAKDYHEAFEAYEAGRSKVKPAIDPTWEPYRVLFRREAIVSVHTQMYQVFSMTLTMLIDEFNLIAVPDHSDFDDYKATSLAIERDAYVICGPRVWWMDGRDRTVNGACASHWRGGLRKVGVNTDAPVVPEEELSHQAAMGVRFGWETYPAILGITRVPAEALGIDDVVGSIAPGKAADLVVFTGDPLDPRSSCEMTMVAGRIAYDAVKERRF